MTEGVGATFADIPAPSAATGRKLASAANYSGPENRSTPNFDAVGIPQKFPSYIYPTDVHSSVEDNEAFVVKVLGRAGKAASQRGQIIEEIKTRTFKIKSAYVM